MNAQMLLHSFAGGDEDSIYIEDVFSTYLYTGNGSTQTINNGIDLAEHGGLVWQKPRSVAQGHVLIDTVRGINKGLRTESTDAEFTSAGVITSFSKDGFNVGTGLNVAGITYATWTFRRAKKFFDIVTYTGNGVAGRQIPHGLGIAPGMIVVKRTNGSGDWVVSHRSASYVGLLNSSNALKVSATNGWLGGVYSPADETFTVGPGAGGITNVNAAGATYVAYLFAHDASDDGFIQCGSFTTDASGNATVNLGWEPQFIKIKASSATSDWMMLDSLRGMPVGGTDARLYANTSGSEAFASTADPTASGFNATSLSANTTYIFTAIRKGPMRG